MTPMTPVAPVPQPQRAASNVSGDSGSTLETTSKQNAGKPFRNAADRHSFWLSATPTHALVETLLIATAVSLMAYMLIYNPSRPGLLQFTANLILLDGPLCALWCAMRLRLPPGGWRRQLLLDSGISFILGLVPFGLMLGVPRTPTPRIPNKIH